MRLKRAKNVPCVRKRCSFNMNVPKDGLKILKKMINL